jgi:bis(5'-adenosyl)-triphosphatase
MHLHIIPRKSGDLEEPGDWYHKMEHSGHTIIDSSQRKKLSEEEIKKWALWLRETDEKM